jgi:uncharacterized delta-60 repeat protein
VFALARYRPNGALDSSFAGDGRVTTRFKEGAATAGSLTIGSNGRIVVAGTTCAQFDQCDFALARYRPNGDLDRAFGRGGRVTTDFAGNVDGASSAVIDSHGRIILAGGTGPPDATSGRDAFDFALARYLPNGSLDPSFGIDGKVTTDLGGQDAAASVTVDAQDRIIADGTSCSSTQCDFAVARYRAGGQLDPAFGNDGSVTTRFPNGPGGAVSVTLDSRGRIVAAGTSGGAAETFALARYTPRGELDPSFGAHGLVTTSFPNRSHAMAYSVAIDSRKQIVAVGHTGRRFALARYDSNGHLDPTFGSDGTVTTRAFGHDFSIGPRDTATSVAIASRDRIVVAGTDSWDFALARYIGYPTTG